MFHLSMVSENQYLLNIYFALYLSKLSCDNQALLVFELPVFHTDPLLVALPGEDLLFLRS